MKLMGPSLAENQLKKAVKFILLPPKYIKILFCLIVWNDWLEQRWSYSIQWILEILQWLQH